MFTGIIEGVGRIEAVSERDRGRRLRLSAPFAAELGVDDSVAVNGVCLTVVACDHASFEADVVAETLSKTNLGDLGEGDSVNLERPLVLGGRLNGHIVQGHVDAAGEVTGIQPDGDAHLVSIRFPHRFAPYLIPVGSVALDGISFTVARLDGSELSVAVIPHTWNHTTVREWSAGRRVNLEFDLIGKYVVRAMEQGLGDGTDVVRRFLTG